MESSLLYTPIFFGSPGTERNSNTRRHPVAFRTETPERTSPLGLVKLEGHLKKRLHIVKVDRLTWQEESRVRSCTIQQY